jgi:GAF domain-containing protein
MLLDEETGDLVFVLVQGRVREVLPGYRIRGDEGLAGWAVKHGKPVIVNDVHSDPRFSARVDQAFGFETHSLICAPLIARKKTLGAIEVVNKVKGTQFADADLYLLSILASVAAIALDDIARQPENNQSPISKP